jgi:hypothetical protein
VWVYQSSISVARRRDEAYIILLLLSSSLCYCVAVVKIFFFYSLVHGTTAPPVAVDRLAHRLHYIGVYLGVSLFDPRS